MTLSIKATAPLAIGAIAILTFGTATGAAASHLITGKDIKDHTITGKDIKSHSLTTITLSKATVKKLTPKPALQWYGAHMDVLNTDASSQGFGSPVGYTVTEGSSTSFVAAVSPPVATTMATLAVSLQSAPGSGATRTFTLQWGTGQSKPCVIAEEATSCSITENVTIPANQNLYLESDVGAVPADGASIGWTTLG